MRKEIKQIEKPQDHHTIMETFGEKATAIKDTIVESKNKIAATVEEKLEAVKKVIHDFTAPAPKKKAGKKSIQKVVKKAVKKAVKKQVKKPVKKTAKKSAKN
jgi:hypothetical protein